MIGQYMRTTDSDALIEPHYSINILGILAYTRTHKNVKGKTLLISPKQYFTTKLSYTFRRQCFMTELS
jgi:hypothetical protein